jgi:hypothetical protein
VLSWIRRCFEAVSDQNRGQTAFVGCRWGLPGSGSRLAGLRPAVIANEKAVHPCERCLPAVVAVRGQSAMRLNLLGGESPVLVLATVTRANGLGLRQFEDGLWVQTENRLKNCICYFYNDR